MKSGGSWSDNINYAEHIQPSILGQWTPSTGASQLLGSFYALLLSPVSLGDNRSVRGGLLCLNKDMKAISAIPIQNQSLKTFFYRRRLPLLCVVRGLEQISSSQSTGKRATAISASSASIWWQKHCWDTLANFSKIVVYLYKIADIPCCQINWGTEARVVANWILCSTPPGFPSERSGMTDHTQVLRTDVKCGL